MSATRLLTRRESFRLDLIEAAKRRTFRENQKRQIEIIAANQQALWVRAFHGSPPLGYAHAATADEPLW